MKSLNITEDFLSVPFPPVFVSGFVGLRVATVSFIKFTLSPQDLVDGADTFPQVLRKVVDWMKLKELGTKYKYSILTDGYVFREIIFLIDFVRLKMSLLILLSE